VRIRVLPERQALVHANAAFCQILADEHTHLIAIVRGSNRNGACEFRAGKFQEGGAVFVYWPVKVNGFAPIQQSNRESTSGAAPLISTCSTPCVAAVAAPCQRL
jgi:hypothetical protein